MITIFEALLSVKTFSFFFIIRQRNSIRQKSVIKESLSPTFYARLFCTMVLRKAFFCLHFRFELFLVQEYWHKCDYKKQVKQTKGFYLFIPFSITASRLLVFVARKRIKCCLFVIRRCFELKTNNLGLIHNIHRCAVRLYNSIFKDHTMEHIFPAVYTSFIILLFFRQNNIFYVLFFRYKILYFSVLYNISKHIDFFIQ